MVEELAFESGILSSAECTEFHGPKISLWAAWSGVRCGQDSVQGTPLFVLSHRTGSRSAEGHTEDKPSK